MAWTTPRTWVAAEIVTASVMNVHVRDNLAYLKGILDGTVAGNLTVTGNITATGTVNGTGAGSFGSVVASDATLSDDLSVAGTSILTDTVLLGAASAPSPGLAFVGDTDTGIGHPAANQFQIMAGNTEIALFGSTFIEFQDDLQINGILTVTPSGGASSGIDSSGNLYTEAGGLNVIGNAVIGGTLTVGGGAVHRAGCRVYHNATVSIANATETVLAFNSERFDSDGFHDTVTNNTRLTVPAGKGGKYLIWANVEWGVKADATHRYVRFRVNGSGAYIAGVGGPNSNTASFATWMNLSAVYDLAAGDYVEVYVRHESGAALNLVVAGNFSPEFGMQLVG